MKTVPIILMCSLLCSCTTESKTGASTIHDQLGAEGEHRATVGDHQSSESAAPLKQADDPIDGDAADPLKQANEPAVSGTVESDGLAVKNGSIGFKAEDHEVEAVINDGKFSIPAGQITPGEYKINITLDPPPNNPPSEKE